MFSQYVNEVYDYLCETSQLTAQNCNEIFKLRNIPTLIPLSTPSEANEEKKSEEKKSVKRGNLYVAGRAVLYCYKQYQIDHILSLIPIQQPIPDVKHDIFEIEDSHDSFTVSKLENELDRLTALIHESIQAGKNVCVHCQAGVSRSVTVVCAYLMKYYGLGWIQAIDRVRDERFFICPNRGFLGLLYRLSSPRS